MPLPERRSLLSLDPEANRFRFFEVELCAVKGGAEIRRRWGRVGAAGRRGVQRFESVKEARAAWDGLLKHRGRRGYVEAGAAELEGARRLLAWHLAARRAPRQAAFPAALGF